jgi:hypothetical protein
MQCPARDFAYGCKIMTTISEWQTPVLRLLVRVVPGGTLSRSGLRCFCLAGCPAVQPTGMSGPHAHATSPAEPSAEPC